jgi:hypothetical protein
MTGRRRAALFALLALLGAVALLAAGCGGGDSESAADETTIETTTETLTEDETTEETTEEETTATGDEDTDLSGIADEDCLELASIGAKFTEALGATGAGTDYETTTKLLDELADKAPDEIKDDLAVLAAAWKDIAAALKDVDLTSGQAPSAEVLAKLQELGTKFNTPKLQQASENLAAWAQEHCGTATP